MLSPKEKQALRNTNVVLKNWFEDLEKVYSHLTAEDIADRIADIYHRYHC